MQSWTDILLVCGVTGVLVFWRDIADLAKRKNGKKKS